YCQSQEDIVIIKEYTNFQLPEIVNLYKSAGWSNYSCRQDILKQAYKNSFCVLAAYESDKLLGILRAVGDGLTIIFIQDIIVLPEYQRKGIGTKLLHAVMTKYKDVYQMELLTDNTDKTVTFYRSNGFVPAEDINCMAFIRK
ncbi:MAG: GNAT family N-acetyltransferase, partial [Eubacteriales bacterium]|nr:GNAT family N-acetyltransferase [Eubacteriales bacterium]